MCGIVKLYPVRGRKQKYILHRSGYQRLQLIPVRGRKQRVIAQHVQRVLIATYPRKGTKTISTMLSGFPIPDCNLSPQGDENDLATGLLAFFPPLQFIPARGRKHQQQVRKHLTVKIAIYPHEGTKIVTVQTLFPCPSVATYPRRGTETGATPKGCPITAIAIYPRKGTETRAYPLPHPACSHCNLSPQGDGNSFPRI